MPALPKEAFPVSHSDLKGIFVGGCVSRGDGSRFRAKAHAHIKGAHQGWICVLAERRLACRELMLHELAHVVSRDGHTDRWRRCLLELGGTLDEVPGILKSYHKKDENRIGERDNIKTPLDLFLV